MSHRPLARPAPLLVLLSLGACARGPLRPTGDPAGETGAAPAPLPHHYVVVGGVVVGEGRVEVEVAAGQVRALLPPGEVDPALPVVDAAGRWIAPGIIDSHVHLAYLPEGEALAAGGVAGAVDLAAPVSAFGVDEPLLVARTGPMVTAVGGYPTRSWGAGGYGLEVRGAGEAAAAVASLADQGAALIKVPLGGSPALDPAELDAVVAAAHARGLQVVAHALGEAELRAAAAAGVDLLAHTPTGPLSAEAARLWAGRGLISTLSAFGGGENLAALRAAGAEVLYGTDFGNTRARGVSAAELQALADAGLDGAAILRAATTGPAARFGFPTLGAVAPGARAHLLVLDADPLLDPLTLSRPVEVLRP
jgi:imidazolonepropionase-like amidohydrolase